jgi:hypothetical protein
MSILVIYGAYRTIQAHAPRILLCLGYVLMLIPPFFLFLCLFYYNKLKILIDGDTLTYKMPDKLLTFNIKNIYKIEKEISQAGIGYYIFYYDDKHKKRHIKFNNDLGGHQELIDYLQGRSGIKMRWEGTFDVEKEKRPVIKLLKIIFNIIVVILLAYIFVIFPFMRKP